MAKPEKVRVNVKERVEDNVCDLSLTGLSEVPIRDIASFKRVNILDLSSNRLTTLGKNFTSLTRIVKLDLSKNQIKYLPDDFGMLRNLRHLDLYDNKLEHLPLSFGNLTSLRYLDLKGNPLTPALAKVVGLCLTTRECQDTARSTVRFLAFMQTEAQRTKLQYKLEMEQQMQQQLQQQQQLELEREKAAMENQKLKKSNKKTKSKNKKSNNNNNEIAITKDLSNTIAKVNVKASKTKKSNGAQKKTGSSTALVSIFTFFVLLAINILIIYMIMFKNPEIAEKLVEFIPHQYRAWILTKTEIFRLHVTDWISEFRTPPEEH